MSPILSDRKVWTWDEYAALPDNGWYRYQVLDGEVFVSPHAGLRHQLIGLALARRLADHVDAHDLGYVVSEINLVMGPGRYVGPDLVFLPKERFHGIQGPDDLWVEVPPALIGEILSPSTRGYDRVKKRRAYEEFGVDEYWIVDPEAESVEVYRFAEAARAGTEAVAVLCRDRLVWTPAPGLPALDIDLENVWKRTRR